ncbi:MAG: hypothetical protein K2Q17_10275 [Nitrospiraceae bacterium]|jgi:hypothetical protein|uniref:hypothetical protein n=1 Tax=Nitrospira cf. moscoviensis SBR1015 TaxID=96242 RepID=UPI000A096E79|nr:hypothetical protein [Nitrospira cf. moscoviensis SBR1015]MBY0248041.1 hypothetical protein [Nitrospiraceae bacterium]OQW31365.1 MAG: hypothetical protein A4E20_03495 [Nitrospira sp. SG-bin2]
MDYALDDVVSAQTNCASLSQGKFIVAVASQPALSDPHLVLYRRYGTASVIAHHVRSDPYEEWQQTEETSHGRVHTLQTATHTISTVVSGGIARWKSHEGYDVKNVAIARSGSGIQNSFWANTRTQYSYEEPIATEARAVLLSEQVIDFCYQHQLSNWLQIALRQVRQNFAPLVRMHVEVEHDRESDEEWLAIIAEVEAEPDAVLAMYTAYTRTMLQAVPWPARDKMRLIYDII